MNTRFVVYVCMLFLGGCVSFAAVPPGESSFSGMTVKTTSTWNQAPGEMSRLSRPDAKNWTRDGMLLDRLMFIPAVPSGEPVFRQTSSSQALPLFDASMLPNEIEELTESSIVKLFGEGGAVVETSKLRPHRFGEHKGIMFDLDVSVSDGPDYRGVTGAMIVDEKLYLVVFLAAVPYYYEKHLDEAVQIIKSSRVSGEV